MKTKYMVIMLIAAGSVVTYAGSTLPKIKASDLHDVKAEKEHVPGLRRSATYDNIPGGIKSPTALKMFKYGYSPELQKLSIKNGSAKVYEDVQDVQAYFNEDHPLRKLKIIILEPKTYFVLENGELEEVLTFSENMSTSDSPSSSLARNINFDLEDEA